MLRILQWHFAAVMCWFIWAGEQQPASQWRLRLVEKMKCSGVFGTDLGLKRCFSVDAFTCGSNPCNVFLLRWCSSSAETKPFLLLMGVWVVPLLNLTCVLSPVSIGTASSSLQINKNMGVNVFPWPLWQPSVIRKSGWRSSRAELKNKLFLFT